MHRYKLYVILEGKRRPIQFSVVSNWMLGFSDEQGDPVSMDQISEAVEHFQKRWGRPSDVIYHILPYVAETG